MTALGVLPEWLTAALPLVALVLVSIVLLASLAAARALRPVADAPASAPNLPTPERPALASTLSVARNRLRGLLGPPLRALDDAPMVVVLGAAADDVARLVPRGATDSVVFETSGPRDARTVLRLTTHADGTIVTFDDGLLGNKSADKQWDAAVERLSRLRPDRPMDGIVVTVPAALLVGDTTVKDEALAALGDLLCRILAATQHRTGWRIPVYLVIDHCETLAGFTETAQLATGETRHRSLGWAVPYALDVGFERSWVREGIEDLTRVLSALQPSYLMRASEPAVAERVLLFPLTLAALVEPLTVLLSAFLRPSAFHQAIPFRGLYLIGRAVDGEALFAQQLFADRIFPEHVLAEPAQGALTRRQRRVRIMQGALAVGICLALLGIRELNASGADRETVRRLLQKIELTENSPNSEVPAANTRKDEDLLGLMSQVSVSRLDTGWAPLSLGSGLDERVKLAIATAVQNTVLLDIHEALSERIPDLLRVPQPVDTLPQLPSACSPETADLAPIDVAKLDRIVHRLTTYQQQLYVYQHLSGDLGIGELASLIEFTLGLDLPSSFRTSYDLYLAAVRAAAAPSLSLQRIRTSVDAILRGSIASAINRAYPGSELARAVRNLVTDSAPGAGPRQSSPIARLQSIGHELDAIRDLAPAPAYAWLGNGFENPDLTDIFRQIAGLSHPSPGKIIAFSDAVPQTVSEAAASCAAVTRQQLRAALAFGMTPVLAPNAAGGFGLSRELQSMRSALDGFVSLPLVAAPLNATGNPLPVTEGPMLWSAQDLQSLQAFAEGYLAFASQSLADPELSDTFRQQVQNAAAWKVSALVNAAETRALDAGGHRLSTQAGDSTALRERVASFAEVVPVLRNLRSILLSGGLSLPAARLDDLMSSQALLLLRAVDALLTAADPYQLADPSLSAWPGSAPLTAAAFGAASSAEVIATLPARRDFVATLADQLAAPLLQYLQQNSVALGGSARLLVDRWASIKTVLDRYNAGSPANSLRRLEQFITVDMSQLDADACSTSIGIPSATDWFGVQLQQIRNAVVRRCRDAAAATSIQTYEAMSNSFNQDLAGRFPFGLATAPDADPGDVKRFFDRFGASLSRLAARLGSPDSNPKARFAAQLQMVQTALAPMLTDPSPTAPLSYEVSVDFRTNAGLDPGADQVAEAVIRIGSQTLSSFVPTRPIAWTENQPVQVRFRWALNAPAMPASGNGLTASFATAGPWSLLRMITAHRPDLATLAGLSDRRPEVLEFTVKLTRNPNAATGGDSGLTAAVLFLRFALTATLHTPGQPDRRQPVALPVFPTAAPVAGLQPVSLVPDYGQ